MAIVNAVSEAERKRAHDLVEMASVIKHDLRGPIQSILMAVQTSKGLEQDAKEMILSGVSRVEKITRDLGQANKKKEKDLVASNTKDQNAAKCSVFLATQEIIQEKTHVYRKIKGLNIYADFNDDSISKFTNIEESDFKRVLSNLIDNSVESFPGEQENKSVRLILSETLEGIELIVSDNGPGIPKAVMKKIGEKGNTFGKVNGNGLGLYSSQKKVLSANGSFDVQTSKSGTDIILGLNVSESPRWFAPSLKDISSSHYILLDDDESVAERFKSDSGALNAKSKKVDSFSTIQAFNDWKISTSAFGDESFAYFIDYDLKDTKQDGLDVIRELGKTAKAYLFTNNFDDYFLQRACAKEGIKIIPKTVLGWG